MLKLTCDIWIHNNEPLSYHWPQRTSLLGQYSNHLLFLTRYHLEWYVMDWESWYLCTSGSLWKCYKTSQSQALLHEDISDGHRQKAAIAQSISMLEWDLSKWMDPETWSRLDSYTANFPIVCASSCQRGTDPQIQSPEATAVWTTTSKFALYHNKLVVNLNTRNFP